MKTKFRTKGKRRTNVTVEVKIFDSVQNVYAPSVYVNMTYDDNYQTPRKLLNEAIKEARAQSRLSDFKRWIFK